MNRRSLLKLLSFASVGAKAAIVGVSGLVVKRKAPELIVSEALNLPVALTPGDRLSVSFSGSEPKAMVLMEETVDQTGFRWKFARQFWDQYGLPENGSEVNAFIAPRNCEITDIRIVSATHGELTWKLHRYEPASI